MISEACFYISGCVNGKLLKQKTDRKLKTAYKMDAATSTLHRVPVIILAMKPYAIETLTTLCFKKVSRDSRLICSLCRQQEHEMARDVSFSQVM